MYDDFYNEPSGFEEQIDEFKAALRASVKEEFIAEMESLRKENDSNRELRNNWNAKVRELQNEYTQKKWEIEKKLRAAEDAARDAKKMRLNELLAEWSAFAYSIEDEYIKQPKCDLCDEYRHRHYTTPLGKKTYEDCSCAKVLHRYHVKKAPLVEVSQDFHGKIITRYLINKDAEESFLRYAETFCDETPFESINTYRPIFRDENRAIRYAAWLNKRQEGTSGSSM